MDVIMSETFWQTPVSIGSALPVHWPRHEVSVPAHTGDEMGRFRDRDGPNLVGVAAQHHGIGPGTRVPEADGLIAGGGDQPSSVPGKRHIANPGSVSFE